MRLVICLAVLFAFSSVAATAAEGDFDPGFGVGGVSYVSADAAIARAMRPVAAFELPGGKLLFAGVREKVLEGSPVFEPEIRGMLLRLNADGTPDATFGSSGIDGLAVLPDLAGGMRVQSLEAIARFDNGSFVAAGTAFVGGPIQGFVVKLTENGLVDESFGTAGVVLFPLHLLHAVRIDALGRIVVAGEHFITKSAAYAASVLRLQATGEPDPMFGKDGTFSISGEDATASGFVNDIVFDPDGGIFVGGAFETDGSGLGIDFSLIKLTQAGELDGTFAGGGWRIFNDGNGKSSKIERLVRLSSGAIAFAGFHPTGENRMGPIIGRVTSLGETDATFGDASTPGYLAPNVLPPGAETADVTSLLVQPDGKLFASIAYNGTDREDMVAIRTTADGALDGDFADAGVFRFDASHNGVFSEIGALLRQSDGRLVVAGRSQASSAEILIDFTAVRLLTGDPIFASGFEDSVP